MDSLERYGKLLTGVTPNEVKFTINFDLVVSVFENGFDTIIETVKTTEDSSFKFPKDWYETILKHWKDYCVYGG